MVNRLRYILWITSVITVGDSSAKTQCSLTSTAGASSPRWLQQFLFNP